MNSSEIRDRFLKFFEKRGHTIIPSASLVPENDPSVLFNTAGMQALVPYLLGQDHPQGKRLVNIQKCVRTVDIDEIGDNTHLTFFEMMGNWSLGDYGKEDAIRWSYELLTNGNDEEDGDKGFGLDPQRMYVTCFEGDENAPKDEESAEIWKDIFEKNGVTGERIYFLSANKNWWSAGVNGPCGPDTEMFYDLTGTLKDGMTKEEYLKADDEQKVVEVWNDVFMEYVKKEGKVIGKLEKKNVDTGSGFERMVAVIEGKDNIFDTSLFAPIMEKIPTDLAVKTRRIIADHLRASVFIIADGVQPGNKDRGYILRRLLRRVWAIENSQKLSAQIFEDVIIATIEVYKDAYPSLEKNKDTIINAYFAEWQKFKEALSQGMKEFEKNNDPFLLFTTYGFPLELIKVLAEEKGIEVDEKDFQEKFKAHQEASRAGAEQKFKGGLGGAGEMEKKYHTATHLLHQALRDVLGNGVQQKGSNITTERLRFDFTYPEKMTEKQKKKVEDIVNEKIKQKLPMQKVVMKKEDAEKTGALHFFGDKYGNEVNVYYIGDSLETAYSKEFCGGPHVENTGVLGHFKIVKEEAISAGIRRIKAILD